MRWPPPERAGARASAQRRTLARYALLVVLVVFALGALPFAWAVVAGMGGAAWGVVTGEPTVLTFGLRRTDAPRYDPIAGVPYDDQGCCISPGDSLRADLHNGITRWAARIGVVSSRADQMMTWDAAQEALLADAAHTLEPGEVVDLGAGRSVRCESERLLLDQPSGRSTWLGDYYSQADPACDVIAFVLASDDELLIVDVSCADGRHGFDGCLRSYDVRTGECVQWIRD